MWMCFEEKSLKMSVLYRRVPYISEKAKIEEQSWTELCQAKGKLRPAKT